MPKTAIIIGATGLVGSCLLQKLLLDNSFSRVKIFVRRPTGITHDKLQEMVIDFDKIESMKEAISGDVLFSCLGTTLKQAGSKEAQYLVDYTYQYQYAKFARLNDVPTYFLVSSTSANPKSVIFYSRMKGELEEAVRKLGFERLVIMQPSVLSGDREHSRPGEKWGAKIADVLGKLFPPLQKYRSISGDTVASAMVVLSKNDYSEKISVYKLDEIHHLG